MGLTQPTVSVTAGPDYAEEINDDLDILDAHTHAPGFGAQITPTGININADLAFGSNSATGLLSTGYNNQAGLLSTSLHNRLYFSGGELYANDNAGNQVKITLSGNVNVGSVGAITGMGGTTATVSYSNATKVFTFAQDSNFAAHLSTGKLVVHEGAAAAENAVSIKSPASLASSYDFILPTAYPASTLPVSMSTAGQLSTATITTAQITDAAVTPVKMGVASSTASSAGSTSYTTVGAWAAVSGLTLSITTYGRPVLVQLQEGADTNATTLEGYVRVSNSGANTTNAKVAFSSDGGTTKVAAGGTSVPSTIAIVGSYMPAGMFRALLDLAAGTYTIAVYWTITSSGGGTATIATQNVKLIAKEL